MSDLAPIFGTQNTKDDDGQVIDSFLIEVDNAPQDLKPAIEAIPEPEVEAPKPTTKLLSTSFTCPDNTWGPTLIFPADAKRKGLTIKVVSPTAVATDGVRIGSDVGLMATSGRLFHGQQLSDALMEHTGSVYFIPISTLSAPITVEAWAVTE